MIFQGFQAAWGADLMIRDGHFKTGHVAAFGKGALEIGEVAALEFGDASRAIGGEAVIDVVHLGQWIFFVVGEDALIFKPDVARFRAVGIFDHGHQGGRLVGEEILFHGEVIDFEIGIAIEHEEGIAEQRQCLVQSSGGATQIGAVVRVAEMNAVGMAIAERGFNLISQIADAENDFA